LQSGNKNPPREEKPMPKKSSTGFDRRDVLKQIATVAGSAPLSSSLVGAAAATTAVTMQTDAASAQVSTPAAPPTGYQSLGADDAAFVEAMVNILCPADHLTPSGVDCGLAIFIDRQLAGGYGKGDNLYMHGPWKQGKPQFGYQLPLTPEQFFKVGVAAASAACRARFGKDLDALMPADADLFLRDVSAGKISDSRVPLREWFNELAYPLFVQACFADPIYGGNNDKVFWRMVGYPGLPATHARDMVEAFSGRQEPQVDRGLQLRRPTW
jgi:gluconate 2-dehydrogenase gamma chain